MSMAEVTIGSLWREDDPRFSGDEARIAEVVDLSATHATLRTVRRGQSLVEGARKTRARLDRFGRQGGYLPAEASDA